MARGTVRPRAKIRGLKTRSSREGLVEHPGKARHGHWVGKLVGPGRVTWPSHAWREARKPWGTEVSLGCSGTPIAGAVVVVGAASRIADVRPEVGRRTGAATTRLTGTRSSSSSVRVTLGLRATGGRTRLQSIAVLRPGRWGERGRHFSGTSNTQRTAFSNRSRKATVLLATPTPEVQVRSTSRDEGRSSVGSSSSGSS